MVYNQVRITDDLFSLQAHYSEMKIIIKFTGKKLKRKIKNLKSYLMRGLKC